MLINRRTGSGRFLSQVSIVLLFALLLTPMAFGQADRADQKVATPAADTEKASKSASFGPAKLAWDTTVRYSPIFRVAKQDPKLTNSAANVNDVTHLNFNQDDGDRNFHRGLVSNRVDVFSEMDLSFGKNFGVRGSTEAWFDSVYNQKTANTSAATYNAMSTDYRHMPPGTKDFQYLNAYLMDAFAYARLSKGNTLVNIRAGQFAQVWGQTLFFGSNGIAGAMAPVDIIKLLSSPNAQFKEIIRPVPQASVQWQMNSKVSVGVYYQFRWDKTWLPNIGSYFSSGDVYAAYGAERFFLSPAGSNLNPALGLTGTWLMRTRDVEPRNGGQLGAQLLVSGPRGWQFGFYGANFHEKTPQQDLAFGGSSVGVAPFGPYGPMGKFGTYYMVYPQDIKTIGMSASKTTGIVNWAAEFSGRWNQDLATTGSSDTGTNFGAPVYFPVAGLPGVGAPIGNNTNHVLYPVGNTVHGNLSALVSVKPNFISRESLLAAEVAWNHCISVTQNDTQVFVDTSTPGPPVFHALNYFDATKATRDAMVMMAVYTPTYRQVRPGWDLGVPVGIQFSPYGRSVLGPGFNTYHGGFFNIGATLAYRDANRFSITYQRFYGPHQGGVIPGQPYAALNQAIFSYGQSYADRNYIALSIYRTFGLRASQKTQ